MTEFGTRGCIPRAMIVGVLASMVLAGCSALPGSPGQSAPPAAEPTRSADEVEREAMECVTGAWEASTAALQALFDEAIAEAGMDSYRIIADGSIVYEFFEAGFGLNVIPTAFTMTMPTAVGDVVGEISGQASATVWTVKGDYVHVGGEAWQNGLTMRWTFAGETMDADTGAQSMVEGLTDVDYFSCNGDELILQSTNGPPLRLQRMTELG